MQDVKMGDSQYTAENVTTMGGDTRVEAETIVGKKRRKNWIRSLSADSQIYLLKKGIKFLWKVPKAVLVPNRSPIDDLYKLFPQLPPGEKPLNDFSCALHKDILLQGKMFICSSCICFHSNIFGYETRVIIYFKNVLAVKREKTAFVVPNAISIQTLHKRYLFCSFLSRESSFKLLSRVWKHFVNEDEKPDKDNSTPPKKIIRGPRKEISEEMLNFSSSSSYGSNVPPRSLLERPHSSPPSIGCDLISEGDEETVTPRKEGEDCVFTMGDDLSEGSSSSLTLDDIATTNQPNLRRIKSTSNISEAAALGHRFCFKNLQRIKNEKLKKDNETSGKLCLLSTKMNEYKSIVGHKISHISSLAKSFRSNHPFVLAISILVLLLSVFTFNLLLRINGITDTLQSHHNDHKITDNVRLKDLFEFKEGVHSANVERVRSILSVNLETVGEVQKALKDLREKLNGLK